MFKSIKLRTIAIAVASILLLSGVCGAIAITAGAQMDNGITVVLDAGHGGIDGGVVGVSTGVKESDINLAITKVLRDMLVSAGYKVVLTRKNSEGLYSPGDKNKKLADLNKRRTIIEQASPNLVVSIHQNSYPLQSVKGAHVFYAPSSDVGQEYASTMQNILNAGIGCNKVPARGDYYILQCSNYPSLLVECGFLSNTAEEKQLVNGEYQQKIAYLIFSGICSILKNNGNKSYDLLYNT